MLHEVASCSDIVFDWQLAPPAKNILAEVISPQKEAAKYVVLPEKRIEGESRK